MNSIEFYSKLCDYKKKSKNYDNVLAHSSNYKYYNKIKLPSGEVRYFYTKEEWDAYNNGNTSSNNKENINNRNIQSRVQSIRNNMIEQRSTRYNHKEIENNNQTAKNGFVSNVLGKTIKNIKSDIRDARFIPDNHKDIISKAYDIKMDTLKTKYKERIKKIDPDDYDYPFRREVRNIDFDDLVDSEAAEAGKKMVKEYTNGQDKEVALRNSGKIINEMFDNIDEAINEDLTKREESIKAWDDLRKTYDKYLITLNEDLENMSAYEKRILADEMGIDSFNDEDIFKKYPIIDNVMDFEMGDDYGASQFNEQTEIVKELWNDYKAAKKALNS